MRKYILIILILCLLLNGCVEEASEESETDDMAEGINEINEIEKEINENELDDSEKDLDDLEW